MTEIGERKIYKVDVLPFILAALGGPLIVTALIFWIYHIPVLMLVYGGPVYLIVGVPTALIHLRFNEGTPGSLVSLALSAVTVGAIPIGLLATALGGGGGAMFAFVMILFAYSAAATWSAVAALIYDTLRSDDSRIPRGPAPSAGCIA